MRVAVGSTGWRLRFLCRCAKRFERRAEQWAPVPLYRVWTMGYPAVLCASAPLR